MGCLFVRKVNILSFSVQQAMKNLNPQTVKVMETVDKLEVALAQAVGKYESLRVRLRTMEASRNDDAGELAEIVARYTPNFFFVTPKPRVE